MFRAADAFYVRRREGPHRFIQNRSRISVVALKSDAAAEKPKDQLSRDFLGCSIFDFCNKICQRATWPISRLHPIIRLYGDPALGYLLAIDVKDASGTSSAYTKPLGSYVNCTSPLSCLPSVSISRVPKLRLSGARTAGPFFSVHFRCRRCVPGSSVQAMSMRPAGTDNAPNFVVLVQSSLRVIAIAITAPDVIRTSGPAIANFGTSGLSKASVAPRTIFSRSALVQRACNKRS